PPAAPAPTAPPKPKVEAGQEPSVQPGMSEPDIVSSPPPAPEPTEQGEPAGPLSPLVRRMARDNNVDLSRVKGTGAGGRITKQDVESYLGQQQTGAPAQAAAPPPQPAPQAPRAPSPSAAAPSMPPPGPSQAK